MCFTRCSAHSSSCPRTRSRPLEVVRFCPSLRCVDSPSRLAGRCRDSVLVHELICTCDAQVGVECDREPPIAAGPRCRCQILRPLRCVRVDRQYSGAAAFLEPSPMSMGMLVSLFSTNALHCYFQHKRRMCQHVLWARPRPRPGIIDDHVFLSGTKVRR